MGEKYPYTKQGTEPLLSADEKLFGKWKISTELNEGKGDESALTVKQIHSGNIVKSSHLELSNVEADGISLSCESTDRVGIYTADCMPVVIMTDDLAIALHVSRKSIVNGLMDNVMSFVVPTEVNHVYVGPHICEYHFSFDEEDYMVRKFRRRFPEAIHFHKGLLYLSLKKALLHFFDEWQINIKKVSFDGRCTYEMLDLPSYRLWKQEGGSSELGRIMTVVERQVIS